MTQERPTRLDRCFSRAMQRSSEAIPTTRMLHDTTILWPWRHIVVRYR